MTKTCMARALYFAYGSNLDREQMRARCDTAELHTRAILREHALAFTGHSRRWAGPVATVVPSRNAIVEGLLYILGAADLRSLDRHEGHPLVYRRTRLRVTDEHGRELRAEVYVQRARRPGVPSPDYARVLRRAYQRLGFDARSLAASAEVVS